MHFLGARVWVLKLVYWSLKQPDMSLGYDGSYGCFIDSNYDFFMDTTHGFFLDKCYNWKRHKSRKRQKGGFLPLLGLPLMMIFLGKRVTRAEKRYIYGLLWIKFFSSATSLKQYQEY